MGRKSLEEQRKKEIITAFYKVSRKIGLGSASIAKTASEMNTHPSLIMHYFKTKEALVYGLVEFILNKYLLVFKDADIYRPPKEALYAVLDNIFSRKWNKLFDDGVSYGCYSLTFKDKHLRQSYKRLLDTLRERLTELIIACNRLGELQVSCPERVADFIFVLIDGAYYYLSLCEDKEEYARKIQAYKLMALQMLTENKLTMDGFIVPPVQNKEMKGKMTG